MHKAAGTLQAWGTLQILYLPRRPKYLDETGVTFFSYFMNPGQKGFQSKFDLRAHGYIYNIVSIARAHSSELIRGPISLLHHHMCLYDLLPIMESDA